MYIFPFEMVPFFGGCVSFPVCTPFFQQRFEGGWNRTQSRHFSGGFAEVKELLGFYRTFFFFFGGGGGGNWVGEYIGWLRYGDLKGRKKSDSFDLLFLPGTNSEFVFLKIDGWKRNFPSGMVYFQGHNF